MKAVGGQRRLPEGFGRQRRGGKICVYADGWKREMLSLARMERADGHALRLLRGRGRPAVVPSGREFLVVRRYYHGGVFRRLTGDRFFGTGRFFNELQLLAAAHRAGIGVPEPAGLLIEPVAPCFFRASLVTVYIPESIDLLSYFREHHGAGPRQSREGISAVIAAAGRQVALLHRAGIFHGDLQVKNILVRPRLLPPETVILDFDRGKLIPGGEKELFRNNLLRLYRSFVKMRLSLPAVSRYDPIRFLRAYAPEDRDFRRRVIRQCIRRERGDLLHRMKWKLSFFLRGSYYARSMEGEKKGSGKVKK